MSQTPPQDNDYNMGPAAPPPNPSGLSSYPSKESSFDVSSGVENEAGIGGNLAGPPMQPTVLDCLIKTLHIHRFIFRFLILLYFFLSKFWN